MTRILIADDHPLVRGALRQAVANAVAGADIVECGSLEEVTKALEANSEVDLVLLDLAMPGVRGFSGLMMLRAQHPSVPVVVVSGREERASSASASISAPPASSRKAPTWKPCRGAIRSVLGGDIWVPPDVDLSGPVDRDAVDSVRRLASLTPQQVRVLMMLSKACSTSRSPMSFQCRRRRSRRMSRQSCRSSGWKAAPRR